jgi:DNA invertase Pin-like site-specific DNA recombinase
MEKNTHMTLNSSQSINNPSNPLTNSNNGCFIYTRVSTDRQAEEGYSLDDQEKNCKELAKKLGYKVRGIYREEGVSGTSINRPKFQEMLDKCSDDKGKSIKAVLVIHTDRFARNTLEHLMVKGILSKYNVKLISALQPMLDDSPEGNLLDVILAGMNEFYSKDLGRKTAKALAQKAEEGWWPGYAPLGYINKTHPQTKKKIIEVDNEYSHYIKRAFKKFATGKYTLESLNNELYQEGFRSKTGKRIHKSTMSFILRKIFYTGKMKIKGKIYQGKHTPLVDMETYLKVQKILDLHNHKASRTRKHNFLLRGLLFCQECQSQLTGERHVKKTGLTFDYYRCMGPKHKEKQCHQSFTPTQMIEKEIVKLFRNITLSSGYIKALNLALERIYKLQNQKDYGWIKALENKKNTILRKMDKLEDLILEDILDKKRIIEKYSKLKEELNSIEDQISQSKCSGKKLRKEDIKKILSFVKSLDKIYVSLNYNNKKLFLRLLIEKIFVKDKKISGVTYTPAFQMIVDKDLVRINTNWLPLLDLIRTIEEMKETNSIFDKNL